MLLLSLVFAVQIIACQSRLIIDTEIKRSDGGWWDDTYHGGIWADVTGRMERMVQVSSPKQERVPLPFNGICGPRAFPSSNYSVVGRHISPDGSSINTASGSMIVYVYTDVFNGICTSGTTIAYASVCASERGTFSTPMGRPVLGYINICMPGM